MTWLKTIFGEAYSLFVDDGSFAVAIIIWVVVAGVFNAQIAPASSLWSIALFVGLALILIESVVRRAKR